MANRSCWQRRGVKDGLSQPGQVLCVFSSDNGAVGTKQRTLWKWVWDLVFRWHWFGLMRVNGLCGERKLLGLLPAAACGDSLDAVTRYKPWSSLHPPALQEEEKWTWNEILTLCSKSHLRSSVLRGAGLVASAEQGQSPALQLGALGCSQGEIINSWALIMLSGLAGAGKLINIATPFGKWMPDTWSQLFKAGGYFNVFLLWFC